MRQHFNGYLYKAAMGVGLLVLVGLVAADIWLWQTGGDSGALGAGPGTSSGSNVPGLPSRSGDSNSSGASVNDSINLEIERELPVSDSGLFTQDGASVGDLFRLETTGSVPGTTINDPATVGDSAVTQVQPGSPPPSGGGPSVVSTFGDSATLVVQDADGNIKQQEEVK